MVAIREREVAEAKDFMRTVEKMAQDKMGRSGLVVGAVAIEYPDFNPFRAVQTVARVTVEVVWNCKLTVIVVSICDGDRIL
ncbi:MAG: hypothetical protein ABSH28_01795 [Acidobacteriota bacterium]|jgi:hypothetical protein